MLWQKFEQFQPQTNFVAWAMRIAQNKAMHFQRSRARKIGLWKPELQDAPTTAVADAEPARPDDTRRPPCRVAWASFPTAIGISSNSATATASPCGRWPSSSADPRRSVHNSLRRIRTTLLECVERVMNQEGRR